MSEDTMLRLQKQLKSQNAIHALFGEVFEDMGGREFLKEWAEDNPSRFISLFVKMVPGLIPTSSLTGDIRISIHNDLGPSPLDGEREIAPEFLKQE
tara:strand:+ start:1054 stop:1341 length:288 start_codon:yes stop_codon:yes gene_type:complete